MKKLKAMSGGVDVAERHYHLLLLLNGVVHIIRNRFDRLTKGVRVDGIIVVIIVIVIIVDQIIIIVIIGAAMSKRSQK